MADFGNQHVQTTVCCKHCNTPMLIEKTCQGVRMICMTCRKAYPITECISQADDVVEEFMGCLYMDRI